MCIDKTRLHTMIVERLHLVLEETLKAAEQAHETATHEENKAENKYDTLGLEAAYLAHGQSKRAQEAINNLNSFKQLQVRHFGENDGIKTGALVEISNQADQKRWVFLSPISGGIEIGYEDKRIMLITPASPLGKALQNQFVGNEVQVNQGQNAVVYEIISVS